MTQTASANLSESGHLRQIIEAMSDGVILIETDGTICWANQTALEMHGVDRVEDLGTDVADYLTQFEVRAHNAVRLPDGASPMERLLAGESFDRDLVDVVRPGENGPGWTHRVRGLALTDRAGRPDCLVLIMDDETERYDAEDRFESAFNANPAPALILDLTDFRHIRVNSGFLEMTGYKRDEIIGRSVYEVDVLEGAARRELAIERMKAGRTIPQMEALLDLPHGGERAVIVAGQPIEVGGRKCMLFTFADLDDRRQAEVALKQSEERFEIAFRLAPVPTILAKRQGLRFLLINDAFTHETGYAQADVVGREAGELPLWADTSAGGALEALLLKDGRARNLDLQLITRSGDAIHCLVSAEAVEIGDQSCVLVVAQNITDRQRTRLEVAGAIEAVMKDTGWITDAVLERLARAKQAEPDTTEAAGLPALSSRAREVLGLVCRGLDDAAIAQHLGVARNTVRNHIAGLYRKAGVGSRAALVIWGHERGFRAR